MLDLNKKFALNQHSFLVLGAKNGAIYNLREGDVYSINEDVVKLLNLSEQGFTIKEIVDKYTSELKQQIIDCFKKLVDMDVGLFIDKKKTVKKISLLASKKPIDFLWLEIINRCNLKCLHCYAKENKPLPNKMSNEDWIKVMVEVYELGCRKIQFIGGEPCLHKKLFHFVKKAIEIGYEFIEIYSNATIFSEKDLLFMAENNVHLAVSVYADNLEIHDKITQIPGSFEKTIMNIKFAIAKNIKVRASVILMDVNKNVFDKTHKMLISLGVTHIKRDIVRPCGNGKSNNIVSYELLEQDKMRKADFLNCNQVNFSGRKAGHECFSKKLCVLCDGNVIPCIMARSLILGNVLFSSISQIIKEEKNKFIRQITKDNIHICKDCEFRYCCHDCRPKAMGLDKKGNLFAKPSNCSYNPYIGEWSQI